MGRILVVLIEGLGLGAWGCELATTIFPFCMVTEPVFFPAVVEL